MRLETIVAEGLSQLKLLGEQIGNAEEMVNEFAQEWRKLGRRIIEQKLQEQLEQKSNTQVLGKDAGNGIERHYEPSL